MKNNELSTELSTSKNTAKEAGVNWQYIIKKIILPILGIAAIMMVIAELAGCRTWGEYNLHGAWEKTAEAFDFGSLASAINGAINGTISLGMGIYNSWYNSQRDKMYDQQNMYDRVYAQNLQNTIFQREDNAITRATADLQNAGLSKYLAVSGGGAGAGQEISRPSPQPTQGGNLQADLPNIAQTLADADLKQKQGELMKQQAKSIEIDNDSKNEYRTKVNQKLQEEINVLEENLKIAKKTGQSMSIRLIEEKTNMLYNMQDKMGKLIVGEGQGHWIQQAVMKLAERLVAAGNYDLIGQIWNEFEEMTREAMKKEETK